jgi:hypothetical protein
MRGASRLYRLSQRLVLVRECGTAVGNPRLSRIGEPLKDRVGLTNLHVTDLG